jgi:hypothetical protein
MLTVLALSDGPALGTVSLVVFWSLEYTLTASLDTASAAWKE